MWTFIHKAGSPKTAYSWAREAQLWIAMACLIFFIYGLFDGLAVAPSDYQQGNVYRIIYLHVPAAFWSIGVYVAMTVAVIVHFIWKIKVADIVAKVSAPFGASLTFLTLITGSIWGEPTWGTWWVWDARLTSELILLFIYFGIISLRSTIPDRELAARASGMVTLIGLVDIPIVHFSVDWWHTLHQGASLHLFSKPTIAPSMLYPLLAMIVAFLLLYIWIVLIRLQHEILQREQKTMWLQEQLQREHS
jgi:heme exporter protein C